MDKISVFKYLPYLLFGSSLINNSYPLHNIPTYAASYINSENPIFIPKKTKLKGWKKKQGRKGHYHKFKSYKNG